MTFPSEDESRAEAVENERVGLEQKDPETIKGMVESQGGKYENKEKGISYLLEQKFKSQTTLTEDERMSIEEEELLQAVIESLQRMQDFHVDDLPREDELGKNFRFTEAVEPARRLVELFKKIEIPALSDFGGNQLQNLKNQAGRCYDFFTEVLEFNETKEGAMYDRNRIIDDIKNSYEEAFETLLPLVCYSLYKTADFQGLDSDARATIQGIKDKADKSIKKLEQKNSDADSVLEEIRKAAAEQGVTQQAIYFKEEADKNEAKARKWGWLTIGAASLFAFLAFGSLFIHKWSLLVPNNNYDTIQLVISKFLIFAVITYVLYLSAKNFLSHKHNAVVNRHRQNALMTYKTLVEASGDSQQASHAILVHAAACIYSPQPTGYMNSSPDIQGSKSIVELLSKPDQ